jgi:hypothetical protein
MGKRKAADASDERPQAQPAQPRREPILVTSKRRERQERLARINQARDQPRESRRRTRA